mmetsp:Transcript_9786/g.12776  ORF Transcript_9786/g.12776 Transcript_9786/m.12776 type:complete len:450 (+) Transcript_9786:147-1496(+)
MENLGRTLTAEERRKREAALVSRGQLVVAKGQKVTPVLYNEGENPPWYCHLCGKLNFAASRNCGVCGRQRKWTVARGNPLHGLGVGAMRKEQIKSVIRRQKLDPNEVVEDNWAPLHFAAFEGNAEMINALIEKGALKEGVNDKGWTALHYAASQDNLEAVAALIDARVNLDAATKYEKSTALHLAAVDGFIEVMKLLLLNGCNPNARNLLGRTAMHLAAEHGDVPAGEVLLAADAHTDVLDNDGWLPIQIAEVKGFQEFVRFLDGKDKARTNDPQKLLKKQSSDPYNPGVLSRQMSRQSSKASTRAGREIQLQGLPKEWHTEEWHNVMHDMERARTRMQEELAYKHKTKEEVELYEYRKKAGFDLDARISQTKREGYLRDLELMKERMEKKAQKLIEPEENQSVHEVINQCDKHYNDNNNRVTAPLSPEHRVSFFDTRTQYQVASSNVR